MMTLGKAGGRPGIVAFWLKDQSLPRQLRNPGRHAAAMGGSRGRTCIVAFAVQECATLVVFYSFGPVDTNSRNIVDSTPAGGAECGHHESGTEPSTK